MQVILFDGHCHLCSRAARFIAKGDKKMIFTLMTLQNDKAFEIKALPYYDRISPSTILLVEKDNVYQKSEAILRIARKLAFPRNLFYIFIIIPPFIRDPVYMFISRNRIKLFGKREECFII